MLIHPVYGLAEITGEEVGVSLSDKGLDIALAELHLHAGSSIIDGAIKVVGITAFPKGQLASRLAIKNDEFCLHVGVCASFL